MKKLLIILSVIFISLTVSITAFASITSIEQKDGVLTVKGKGSSGFINEDVLIHLYNGEFNPVNPMENLVSMEETQTLINGNYSCEIALPDGLNDGTYLIRMGDSSGDVCEKTLLISSQAVTEINLSCNATGNIFFNPSSIALSAKIKNLSSNVKNYKTVVKVVNTKTDEEVLRKVVSDNEFGGNETKTIKINFGIGDEQSQYGIFEAYVYVVPSSVLNPLDYETDCSKIRFSVAMKNEEQNEKLGMHTQFGLGYANPKLNLKLLKNAGFSTIRDFLDVTQCLDDNNKWKIPQRYENWKDDAFDNNMKQIIQYSYNREFTGSDESIADFKDFAVKAASELVKDGVYDFELLNELNWSTDYTYDKYAKLIIGVAPYVKAVDPKINFIAFANAGIDNFHSVNYIINTLSEIKRLGYDPHDLIDYISIHPYKPLNQYPEKVERTDFCTYGTESYPIGSAGHNSDLSDTIPGDSSLVARTKNLKTRLENDVDCGDIPLIITEIGWYSLEGASSQTTCEDCIENEVTSLSEEGQAKYTLRATALLYDDYEKICYHTMNNKPNNTVDWEINFGFTRCFDNEEEIPYEAKPVFLTMSAFNNIIGNANVEEKNVDKSGKFYDYVFNKNGKRIHLMWTPFTKGNRTITTSKNQIIVRDMYGNIMNSFYSDNNTFTLSVTDSPIYVEETELSAKILFKNEKGEPISTLKNETGIFAEVYYPNKLNLNNGNLIISLYNDIKLVDCQIKTVKSSETVSNTNLIDISDANKIKAFYWNENQSPLSDAIEITK